MIEFVTSLHALWLLIGVGIVGGVLLTNWLASHRTRALDAREAELQSQWNALLTAQHLNAAFMEARRTMWEEAVRQHHRPNQQ